MFPEPAVEAAPVASIVIVKAAPTPEADPLKFVTEYTPNNYFSLTFGSGNVNPLDNLDNYMTDSMKVNLATFLIYQNPINYLNFRIKLIKDLCKYNNIPFNKILFYFNKIHLFLNIKTCIATMTICERFKISV